MWRSTELQIRPGFLLALALSCFAGGRSVLSALLAAALCHEAAHLAVLWCFRVPVERVSLTGRGAEICAPMQTRLSYGREIAAVAAGPLCNLLLAFPAARLAGWYLFAGASFLLGVFNLLPVERLDGGRLLHLLISWLWEPFTADRVCRVVSIAVAWSLTALIAGLLIATGQGLLLLVGAVGLLLPRRLPSLHRAAGGVKRA